MPCVFIMTFPFSPLGREKKYIRLRIIATANIETMIMEEHDATQRQSVVESNFGSPVTPSTSPTSIEIHEGLQIAHSDGCCNVYVANLPPSADAQAIRALFETVGKVLHVKLLLDIASGVSRGIAFVMFEGVDLARKACTLKNKVVLDGNVLQVRLAERSSLHSSVSSHVRSSVVYIRNVPGNITHDMVKRFCEEKFGPVIEVSPHPQSAELKGPSPFNMDFVVFKSVDDACRCVEAIDGRATFPMPPTHPFTMAKMITDVAGEMRKSILLRRRSSDNQANRRGSGAASKMLTEQRRNSSGLPPPPPPPFHAFPPSHLPVNPQFQPFVQQPQAHPQSFMGGFPHQQPQAQPQAVPMYSLPVGQSSPLPMYDSLYNNMGGSNQGHYLDTSHSHRSSLDTSMFQSHRGSLMMLNSPQGQPFSALPHDGSGSGSMPGLHALHGSPQNQMQHPFFQPRLSQPHLMSQPMQMHSSPLPSHQFSQPMQSQPMSMAAQTIAMPGQQIPIQNQQSPLQPHMQPSHMHSPQMVFMPIPNPLGQ